MRQVRAKFRCLSIAEKWDGKFVAELGPVMQKAEDSNKENKAFWKYTPSGDASLTYNAEHPLKVGDYYYIDMVPKEDGDWTLSSVLRNTHGGEIVLSHHRSYDYKEGAPKGLLNGQVKMSLSDEAEGALAAFSEVGSAWGVAFNFAEASDD